MNIISEATVYFIVASIIFTGMILFNYNFYSILCFKWYIDYFNLTDKTCNKGNVSKLEIDRLRYNLYSFLNNMTENDIKFSRIEVLFKSSFYLFIVYYLIFICVPFSYMAYLTYIKEGFHQNAFIYYVLGALFVVYFIYIGVNASVVKNFDDMKNLLSSDNSDITRYKRVYKILNALMLVNNMHDHEMEYENKIFNENPRTFDEILEGNIASRENIYNTSKIKQIKLHCFEKLDFCKYLVLDTLSHHYLKFFKNIYVRLPETSTDVYDISENMFLSELYKKNKLSTSNYEKVNNIYQQIRTIIDGDGNNTYIAMKDKIDSYTPYASLVSSERIIEESKFAMELQYMMQGDIRLEAYNKILYDKVSILINSIKPLLFSPLLYEKYKHVNDAIEKKLRSDNDSLFSVPNNDYIKYLVDNIEILLNANDATNTEFVDIIDKTNEQGQYIYAYFVFWGIILMIFCHILFVMTDGVVYSAIMTFIIVSYMIYFYYRSIIKDMKKYDEKNK